MKILIATYALRGGGVESMVVGLANEMSGDHDVEVLTIHAPMEGDMRRLLSPRVKVSDAGKRKSLSVPAAIMSLYRHIRRGGYDVVHLNGEFYYFILPALMLGQRTAFVYTVHNDARKENNRWNRLFKPLKGRFFSTGRMHAVTISGESGKSFAQYYGSSVPHTLVANGIPYPQVDPTKDYVARWRPSPSTLMFVNPGRICPQKNQEELVKAFARLAHVYDICLIIAGAVDDKAQYKRIEPYLSDRIVYAGMLPDMPGVMASCDAMVLPSKWEGMPVSLIEAFAVGCIPLCTAVGGMADAVDDDVNGLIVHGDKSEDIYNALERFIVMDDCRRTSLRMGALASFPPYSIKATARKYISLYNEIIHK